jgi:Fe2+ transport system protein B
MGIQKAVDRIAENIDEKQDIILSNLTPESVAVYSFLKDEYAKGDILHNLVFQFAFRSYYRMDGAGLSDELKHRFFELMAKKQTNLETILSELHKIPTLKGKNTMQFSFATKLMHTIDNSKPIFDSKIAHVTKIRPKASDEDTKIRSCVEAYESLEKLYETLDKDPKIKGVISKFRSRFSVDEKNVSDTKVLDFLLWSLGKSK